MLEKVVKQTLPWLLSGEDRKGQNTVACACVLLSAHTPNAGHMEI